MPITDSIIDFWPFDEGSGSVAQGAYGNVDLALSRADQITWSALSTSAGWTSEPGGRTAFNGGGLADLAAYTLLASEGDAVTMAARIWLGGGMDVQPSYDPQLPGMYMGLTGHYDASEFSYEAGWRMYSAITTDLNKVVIDNPGGSTFVMDDWTFALGSPPSYNTVLFVITVERLAFSVRIRCAINGTFLPDEIITTPSFSDASRATFGGIHWARCAVSQAAMWARLLTDDEVTTLGGDLDSIDPDAIDPMDLTNDEGDSILHPASITRVDRAMVLATEGDFAQRHTRLAAERAPRRYELEFPMLPPTEHAAIVAAMNATRGGLMPVLWRHPIDDDAPTRYRFVTGSENPLELARTSGGSSTRATITLEEV